MRRLSRPARIRRIARARLGQHHDFFGRALLVEQAEGGGAAHPVDEAGQLLEAVRRIVAAVLDDQVLAAAGDVKLAVGEITEIAGVEPISPGARGTVPSSRYAGVEARRADQDAPDTALGQFGSPSSSAIRTDVPVIGTAGGYPGAGIGVPRRAPRGAATPSPQRRRGRPGRCAECAARAGS